MPAKSKQPLAARSLQPRDACNLATHAAQRRKGKEAVVAGRGAAGRRVGCRGGLADKERKIVDPPIKDPR